VKKKNVEHDLYPAFPYFLKDIDFGTVFTMVGYSGEWFIRLNIGEKIKIQAEGMEAFNFDYYDGRYPIARLGDGKVKFVLEHSECKLFEPEEVPSRFVDPFGF
jgi:hypothetical protein